jgi:hypothetical protein
MSGFEGPILKGMNPFDNNEPRLTASERIRNKRDATIYQAEKQRFQNKKTCGNKNVKYYENGTIRSMKSYKLQKSLARGNVLCEDCDDKGLLCGGVANHDALASIRMGNNIVSEYWGGGGLVQNTITSSLTQSPGFPVIQSDVSGVWDPSAATVTDPSKSTLAPGFGYIDNLIKIPRNLDGTGVVIDPSNELFPDELCEPFRYLQSSNLKTYLVVRGAVPIAPDADGGVPQLFIPGSCSDPSYNYLIGQYVLLVLDPEPVPHNGSNVLTGIIKAICCRRSQLLGYYTHKYIPTDESIVGIFDTYIELLNISDYSSLAKLINMKPTLGILPSPTNTKHKGWIWPGQYYKNIHLFFGGENIQQVGYYGDWVDTLIESFSIIQGTIPPTHNQTKYNATQQSYMSCLENGTRKINFTKNTVKQNNIIASYCKVLDASGNS